MHCIYLALAYYYLLDKCWIVWWISLFLEEGDKVNSTSTEGEGDGVTRRKEKEGVEAIGTVEKK